MLFLPSTHKKTRKVKRQINTQFGLFTQKTFLAHVILVIIKAFTHKKAYRDHKKAYQKRTHFTYNS